MVDKLGFLNRKLCKISKKCEAKYVFKLAQSHRSKIRIERIQSETRCVDVTFQLIMMSVWETENPFTFLIFSISFLSSVKCVFFVIGISCSNFNCEKYMCVTLIKNNPIHISISFDWWQRWRR